MMLHAAIVLMVANPSLMAMRPPDRIVGFNPGGMLCNFALGPRAYARLNMQDFLVDVWEVHTPEEIDAAARGVEPKE